MKVFVLSPDVHFSPSKIENDGKIVSVFLERGSNELRNFRCLTCGKLVFKYTGNPEFIFDGAIFPKNKSTIDVYCHRCKVVYRII